MRKNIFVSMGVFLVLGSIVFAEPQIPQVQLPESWFQLPENGATNITRDPFSLDKLDSKTSDGLDLMIATHAKAWDRVIRNESSRLLSPSKSTHNPWHLEFLALDIGASIQGALGVLFLKGETLLNIYWRKHHSQPTAPIPLSVERSESDLNSLVFSDWIPPEELKEKLEPLIRSALSTGRIRNAESFRKNLWDRALTFDVMARTLALQDYTEWVPSRLRLDLTVTGDGMVYPGTIVGGLVKLRFDWFPQKKNYKMHSVKWMPDSQLRDVGDKFKEFLDSLTEEIKDVNPNDYPAPVPLALNQIMLTLGVSAKGKFGVASFGASVLGHLSLRKVSQKPHMRLPKLHHPLVVIGGALSPSQKNYADRGNVSYLREQNGNKDSTIFLLSEGALKKGLDKAQQMGVTLANHTLSNQGQYWDVDGLRVQFALSIGGTVAVATVSGQVAIQLSYTRT